MDEKNILFGIPNSDGQEVVTNINKIILYTKYFIFKCKLNDEQVMFNNLVTYINCKCGILLD